MEDLQEETRTKIEELSHSKKLFLRNFNTFYEFEDFHKIQMVRNLFASEDIIQRIEGVNDLKSIFSNCSSYDE